MEEQEQSKENEQQAGLDAWDEFLAGDFLKAESVKDKDEAFTVLSQQIVTENNERSMRIELQKTGIPKPLKLDLNKTNIKFVKSAEITPEGLIGKKLYFNKVETQNPKGEPAIGIRIYKIE
ncbi:hypothetical protein LCGC14_1241480 [marine sediment metagenome]|uniref:Uncharacterized protein n=1 Tax=marine sediment metagenome TaxID=412755 RepID=A0A0F9NMU5_9ZZZZ